MIACYLFLLMDKHWYHKLLKGSVDQALALDEKYGQQIPALGLTSKISGASPIVGFRKSFIGYLSSFLRMIKADERTYSNEGKGNDLKSTGKIELFYFLPIRAIQITLFLSFFFGGIRCHDKSLIETLFNI